jgi:hypothetical protein
MANQEPPQAGFGQPTNLNWSPVELIKSDATRQTTRFEYQTAALPSAPRLRLYPDKESSRLYGGPDAER